MPLVPKFYIIYINYYEAAAALEILLITRNLNPPIYIFLYEG